MRDRERRRRRRDQHGGQERHGVEGVRQEDGGGAWLLPEYDHGPELGAGGCGRVVLARHRATGTPVAIKYLHDPAAGADLRQEATVLARVDSPHVVRFYEYVDVGPYAAIVMELVDGISLHDLIRAEGATSPEGALAVLKGSLLGLAAAHAVGLVHRDYKPANILVRKVDGVSKLVDFGIAVPGGDRRNSSGTLPYMAPERWAGAPASPAADVYAATATFFECLTGKRPFDGITFTELLIQHQESRVPVELVPEAVRPLVLAGMAKPPHDRPADAAEFVRLLEAVAAAAYGPDWEDRGHADLAALVGLSAALLPSNAAAAPGGPTGFDPQLVAAEGSLPSRSMKRPGGGVAARTTGGKPRMRGRVTVGRPLHPRTPRRRRNGALAGAVAGTLTLAVLAGMALAGRTEGGERVVTGSPMLRVSTTLDPEGGDGAGTTTEESGPAPSSADGPASTATSSTPSAARTPATSPSPSAGGSSSTAPSPPPTTPRPPVSSPPRPQGPATTGTTATTGTATRPAPAQPPNNASAPGSSPSSASSTTTTPAVGTPTTAVAATTVIGSPPGSSTATPTSPGTKPPTPVPTRVISLNVDSLHCYDTTSSRTLQARITVVASGPAGATLTVSWQHHSGAINPPVTVATDTVRLGTGSVTLTRIHDFGADTALQWGVRVGSDPRPESPQTSYRELPAIECQQPG